MADSERQSTTYEARLYKYAMRGFSVVVPGLDVSLVHKDLYDCDVRGSHGAAKLLLLERLSDRRHAAFYTTPTTYESARTIQRAEHLTAGKSTSSQVPFYKWKVDRFGAASDYGGFQVGYA